MARRKLRIGVIGLGRIGWNFHCRVLGGHKDFTLVGVADADPERGREARDVYGCQSYGDYRALLDMEGLEVVTIAAPTHLHREMALEAFRRGLHVYMEKPLAADVQEARAIARAATRRGLVLSVYQPHRASAEIQHLQKIVASGRLGRVYQVRFGRFNCVRRNDWQSLKRYGGGMLNNYGAHYLDLLLQVLGYDVKRVFCQMRRVLSLGDAEDVVRVVVETRAGGLGEIDINQATAISPFELEVVGTRGALVKEGAKYRLRYFDPGALPGKALDTSLASAGRQYPRDQIEFREEVVEVDEALEVDVYADLARAVRTGAPPFVLAEQAVAVMKLMEACRQSSGRVRVTPA